MEKPLLFSDRQLDSSIDSYIFISYAHENMEEVYEILKKLYDAGFNYWYDSGIKGGSIWNETVKDFLCRPNCHGVILFLSPEFVSSAAVEEELNTIRELIKERGEDKFPVVPVLITGGNYNDVVRKLYDKNKELSAKELEKAIPQKRIVNFFNFFPPEKIFFTYDDPDLINKNIEVFEEHKVIVNTEVYLNRLKGSQYVREVDRKLFVSFGKYFLTEGPRETIEWKILDIKTTNGEAKMILVSTKILDVSKSSECLNWLDRFKINSFDEREKECFVGNARLLNFEETENLNKEKNVFEITEYCRNRIEGNINILIWFKDEKDEYSTINWLSKRINTPKSSSLKYGIVPVIELNLNEFLERQGR